MEYISQKEIDGMKLSDLKKIVIDLTKNFKNITNNLSKVETDINKVKTENTINKKAAEEVPFDPDINQDGVVSPMEYMYKEVILTSIGALETNAKTSQRNMIYVLLVVFSFLVLSAILAALGISIFF